MYIHTNGWIIPQSISWLIIMLGVLQVEHCILLVKPIIQIVVLVSAMNTVSDIFMNIKYYVL